jgi:hypothetical protein
MSPNTDTMDFHFICIFDELQKMETRLADRIEGRYRGFESRVEEPFFEAEFVIDEGPIFDMEPISDRVAALEVTVAARRPESASSDDDHTVVPLSTLNFDGPDAVTDKADCNSTSRSSSALLQASTTPISIIKELVVDPILAVVASLAIYMKDSDTNCSTKCLCGAIDVMSPTSITSMPTKCSMICLDLDSGIMAFMTTPRVSSSLAISTPRHRDSRH